jgi:Rps23 Pro-64 3,4-dihydroxylase Tpa1-like proline 4-hydroxylase
MSAIAKTLPADELPELNPALDCEALATSYARTGRIHIPDALTPSSAERVYRCLREETPWSFLVHKDGRRTELRNLAASDRAQLAAAAWAYGQDHFAYCYDNHYLSHGLDPYLQPQHYQARVVEFLNSPAFISVMRRLTGMEGIAFADANATLYRPGDFLSAHNDLVPGQNRLAAYVISMTPGWRADWGGLLQFLDAGMNVEEEGYVPAFNALNLFRVPRAHRVSRVAPDGASRYSITGWLRSL